MTNILDLIFKKHSGKLEGTSPRKNQFDVGLHGGKELLYHLMSQYSMMSMVGASSVDVLPNLLSMIVHTMSVEVGATSLAA